MAAVATGIADDRLDAPTPCAGTPVAALLSHVLMLSRAFRGAAEKAPDQGPPPAGHTPLPAHWRTALPADLAALAAAWRDPRARSGTTTAGGLEMPAPVAATVALDELVLHGWDLAMAADLDYAPGAAEVEACLGFVGAAARPEGVPGLFGPTVPVAADAPASDRLLGLSGRDPAWSAPVQPPAPRQ
jgi:uncharacterized protein (TIGR03086 family)